jgi:DNA repair exonuclease SbcCD ATPase subunit
MISRLRFKGLACYREEQVLDLRPISYGIVASQKDDPEASNWCGKSTILEIVKYVLDGTHRYLLDDDFISHGEPVGEGELTMGDGARILRTRSRGKRTTLYFWPPGADPTKPLMQDEAQLAIAEYVGLARLDFEATCFFEQKSMSKFVTLQPSKRMEMVSAWFDLGPLEECVDRVSELSRDLESSSKQVEGHFAALEQRERDLRGPGLTDEALVAELKRRESVLEENRGLLSAKEEAYERANASMAAVSAEKDLREVVAEGKAEKARFEEMNVDQRKAAQAKARADLDAASQASASAEKEVRLRRGVARGEFDGKCPVAGIECPARAQINEQGKEARSRLAEASRELEEAETRRMAARRDATAAEASVQEADRVHVRLEGLRQRAKDLMKKLAESGKPPSEVPDFERLRREASLARDGVIQAELDVERVRNAIAEIAKIVETRKQLAAKRDEISATLGVMREASVIFGKRGAQRVVAETNLARIEEEANAILRDCGLKLEVEVRWSREGRGIAKTCEQCGSPFPASAKVKTCQRCGAARGNQVENKLDVVLSNRSGAAEDLAGIAVQLAASRWLRASRGSTWETVLIDEPFGALDASKVKSVGKKLPAMLAGTFAQAFVVSHVASTTHALPGRIEIVSDGKWSTAKVVA